MIHFHIITLFPESIESYLGASIIGKAQKHKKIKISFYDPKDYTRDRYGRVDRKPYGGGPGMVLEPDAILRAVMKATARKKNVEVIFFSTAGAQFDEGMAQKLSRNPRGDASWKHIVLICGHYEGIDARVEQILKAKPVTVGPYVLTGGELPAATMIDAISRFVPGVLGKAESLEASRASSPDVYTRPEVLTWKGKKYRVPEVLLSGNHAKIDEWRRERRNP
jgi:tRNA (guanine37-N1)-methyltransferase